MGDIRTGEHRAVLSHVLCQILQTISESLIRENKKVHVVALGGGEVKRLVARASLQAPVDGQKMTP